MEPSVVDPSWVVPVLTLLCSLLVLKLQAVSRLRLRLVRTLTFTNNVISGQFGLGAGADLVGGNIIMGTNAVSFFSGSGNDTFDMTQVTQAGGGGTAYFWNEAGTDSIVLGGQIDGGTLMPLVVRLLTSVSQAVLHRTSALLPALSMLIPPNRGTFSSNFTVHNNVVSFGFCLHAGHNRLRRRWYHPPRWCVRNCIWYRRLHQRQLHHQHCKLRSCWFYSFIQLIILIVQSVLIKTPFRGFFLCLYCSALVFND